MGGLKALLIAAFALAGTAGAARAIDTVRVAEVPFISSGAFLIAREKGYFRKVGINIVTRIFDDGSLSIPAMLAGEIDVTTAPASAGLFNSVAKGAPIVLFLDRGRDSAERAYASITVTNAMAGQGIRSAADFAKLKGKRIGIPAIGSYNHFTIALALQQAGLDPVKDVVYVSGASQPDLTKMIGQENIDAATLSYNFSLYAENHQWGPLVATGGDIFPGAQITCYAARKDFAEGNRDVLVRFAMAYLRGVQDFDTAAGDPKAHADEVKMLADNTALSKPELVAAIAPHWAYISPDGVPNAASVMKMQDFWADRFGLVAKKVGQDQLFDLSIAKEAKERLDREKPFG